MRHSHHQAFEYGRIFRIGIGLNLIYVGIEAGMGFRLGSMALLSDAVHNLGDVLALLLAWGAINLAERRPSQRRTYGLKRATVLASLASSLILCSALGALVWEAIERLGHSVAPQGLAIAVVAGIGVCINGVTAIMLAAGSRADLNVKGAFLHMAADATVSLGVVLSGIVIAMSGWHWVDPVTALLIAVVVLVTAFDLLRESLALAMDAVPRHIDPVDVREYLAGLPGVAGVHDLHIWGMSTTETALTAHLVIPQRAVGDDFYQDVATELARRFSIQHPTIQVETGDAASPCITGVDACSPAGSR
jgi:cobalt-zinc-cadmium efflux system protein